MPQLPDGDPAPPDGRLPSVAGRGADGRGFGVYLHVPFCAQRCGYCDFNTYTPGELHAEAAPLALTYLDAVSREIDLAATVLDELGTSRAVSTVFVGGGTPTMLSSSQLVGLLRRVRDTWGLADQVEVTTEANPDSVTPASLAELAAGGFTRVSFGMQSAVRSVLTVLDRTHDPERIASVVQWARDAGLHVSLDLIYGTPGESVDDWRVTVEAALANRPDHLSAYALTVEDGTELAARVRRGVVSSPDPDDQATKYELADEAFAEAGYHWYEVSNWARGASSEQSRVHRCQHNLGYWRGDDWWGLGPGAHSHVGGVRWWNVKHPSSYARRLQGGQSPAAGREVLSQAEQRLERLMLGVRVRDGLPWTSAAGAPNSDTADSSLRLEPAVVDRLVAEGLAAQANPLRLTRRGRLLADHVVRELIEG